MTPKILVVLTSAATNPSNGQEVGWYLPELAHPWDVLKSKVDFVVASPKGGVAPISTKSVELFASDPVSSKFFAEQKALWEDTVKLSDVLDRVDEFDAIYYPGGHGPMFDLYSDLESISLIQKFALAKKPIGAVCHGPAAFLNVTLPSGEPLIASAAVTGFSDEEEDALGATAAMPFSLEQELQRLSGGGYGKADEKFGEKIFVSQVKELGGALVTGQNPASGKAVGEALGVALGL
ncbi:class I glutamine amidotransferase-like protein [Aspergillus granulosus]|uniref:D-lactate dehydratase n=1 Tax=Aspergillus granulosus TaxID=176169 RepID=A0ABR4GSP8_9EURO